MCTPPQFNILPIKRPPGGANAKRPDSFIKTDKSASAGNFKLFAPTVCGYAIIFLF